MTQDVRYDEMFRAVGCHTELVTDAAQIRPALDRALSSGKPALLNVIGEQQNVHPYRMRCNVVDTWSRANFDALPAAAQEEMRALPRSEFERASKRTRDNLFGTAVPVEELMRMVGRAGE
jgi:acetolactate synthase-1/2/3 large subunit